VESACFLHPCYGHSEQGTSFNLLVRAVFESLHGHHGGEYSAVTAKQGLKMAGPLQCHLFCSMRHLKVIIPYPSWGTSQLWARFVGKWLLAQHCGSIIGARVSLIEELWWCLPSSQKVSVCSCSHPALMGSYRNTTSGLHDKPLLVNECNAAKGSRQASCVPLEEAMAPLAGLLVADCERSTQKKVCGVLSGLGCKVFLHVPSKGVLCLSSHCGPVMFISWPPLFRHSAANLELMLRRGIQLFN